MMCKMGDNNLIEINTCILFDIPRHGSLVSRNSSSVTHPPPTRTITVLFKNRTNRMFCFSPNYSTRNGAHSTQCLKTYYIYRRKKTNKPQNMHTNTKRKRRVQVFTSCPTRYRMNLFLAYSLSFIMQPLIEENKRGT